MKPVGCIEKMQRIERIGQWALQFTPEVCLTQTPHGIVLELSRCLRLWGGLTKLKDQLVKGLHQFQGEGSQPGLFLAHAPTPRAAEWLAYNQQLRGRPWPDMAQVSSLHEAEGLLSKLPIQALHELECCARFLTSIGIHNLGGVLKLLRHEILLAGSGDLLGMPHGPGHPLGRRCEHEFGTERLEHPSPLEAHALRHRHPQLVATGRTDIRQADPSVSTGGLDHDRVGADLAVSLGRVDHRAGDPVFHAPERIHVFDLAHDGGHAPFGHPPQPHQGRSPDALRDVVANTSWLRGRDHQHTSRERSSSRARSPLPGGKPPRLPRQHIRYHRHG